jgi:hypothetical protein
MGVRKAASSMAIMIITAFCRSMCSAAINCWSAIRDGIADIATATRGAPTSRNNGKLRYGRHGSLSVDTDRGVYYDHEAGAGGDAIKLIQQEYNTGFLAAVVFGEELLGLDGNDPGPARQTPRRRPNTATAAMRKPRGISRGALNTWNAALPLEGSIAAVYFRDVRRCGIPGHHCCRFVPSLRRHKSGLNFPAIVSLVSDAVTLAPLTLHMTFLAPIPRNWQPSRRRLATGSGHI